MHQLFGFGFVSVFSLCLVGLIYCNPTVISLDSNGEQMINVEPTELKPEWLMVDDMDDSQRIIYSQVPMNNLVQTCLRTIPLKYRERCLTESFERYAGSVFPQKARCCTKWSQMNCLEQYTYNTIYCNMHQQAAVQRYFDQVRSLKSDGSPECLDYRPMEEEQRLWSSHLGRVAKCATSVEQEFLENPPQASASIVMKKVSNDH